MGLDTVELILSIEETFEVSISDERAQRMRTVGDIYEFLLERCPASEAADRPMCLSAPAFYRLRRGLCEVLGSNRRDVRPDASIETLLPASARRKYWHQLRDVLALRLPALSRPTWLGKFLFYGPLGAVALAAIWLAIDRPRQLQDGWPALAIWGIYLVVEGHLVTGRDAICLPEEIRTAGDLARYLVDHNYGQFRAPPSGWHSVEIWDRLVYLISECLGAERAKITPEATIVGDLGAG